MGRLSRVVSCAAPWALAIGLLAAPRAGAHAQTLRGTVREAETDRAVPTARLILLDTRGDTLANAGTDALGLFTISSPTPGDFILHVLALGYRTSRGGVFELGPGGELELDIHLTPEPVSIDGFVVEGAWSVRQPAIVESGFLDRMAQGRGVFFTPQDLERSSARTLHDVLAHVPQLVAFDGNTGPRLLVLDQGRYCVPSLVLDGVLVSVAIGRVAGRQDIRGTEGDVNAMVPTLRDVEAVEVYRGGGEIPSEFAGMSRGECGAIVVWTRRR
jgi:hypothetical protein